MAAKVLKETKSMTAAEMVAETGEAAVTSVKCCCCALVEECTQAYIGRVKERYGGRWICGLCSEAVKEEREREKIMITTDEALKRHMRFCQQFRSSTPPDSTNEDFILAVKQILFRTLDSPRKDRFICRPLGRSQSCFSTMQGTQQAERELITPLILLQQ
ncbi:uncharacterized protein LOC124842347 isoform X1 [Vigna umbellata]|uniref:uncharacterized protein LOC124842347 isoform X1 n=2 Tax=Vigna umbellata TaxID=87088 RepID=UPI001F5E3CDE|nr:uncharacterized protein LOC124842347 isoform X1 [Vigna umbellata]